MVRFQLRFRDYFIPTIITFVLCTITIGGLLAFFFIGTFPLVIHGVIFGWGLGALASFFITLFVLALLSEEIEYKDRKRRKLKKRSLSKLEDLENDKSVIWLLKSHGIKGLIVTICTYAEIPDKQRIVRVEGVLKKIQANQNSKRSLWQKSLKFVLSSVSKLSREKITKLESKMLKRHAELLAEHYREKILLRVRDGTRQKNIVRLKDEKKSKRVKAVKNFFEFHYLLDEACISALTDALEDPEWEVRLWALRSLTRNRAPGLLERLPKLVTDVRKMVRRETFRYLDERDSPEVIKAIRKCTKLDLPPKTQKKLHKILKKKKIT